MSASQAALLASLSEADRAAILASLSDREIYELEYDWLFWARENQVAPDWDWRTWLLLAGRGFGKTRTGAEQVRMWADELPGCRIALVAPTAADARDVMVEGESGLLAISPPWNRPTYEPSKRRVTWSNGSQAALYSAEEADRLRGPQHHFAWGDEVAAWKNGQDAWDMLQFGLRLGDRPRVVVTTTPRPIPLVRALLADETTAITRGSTFDNRSNLAPRFVEQIVKRYEGTRLGRQELYAEVLDDVPGALWTRSMIPDAIAPPACQRIVVAIDPSGVGSADDDGDEIGIVAAGKTLGDRAVVLADRSVKASPAEWARRAIELYNELNADLIVAEINYGGAMVVSTIRSVAPKVPVKVVTASRGKHVRAEPVAALYEQKRVDHADVFPALEEQMVSMTSSGYLGDGSPDRLDAMVWALSELMLEEPVPTAQIGRYRAN